MSKIDKLIIKDFNKTRNNPKFLCNAPFCAMNFTISGLCSPCCRNVDLFDCYPIRNIGQIWNGKIFKEYRKSIKKGKLPNSCIYCESRLLSKQFSLNKIPYFDNFDVKRIGINRIQSLQLTLGNTCNLKCTMCNEMFSSKFDQTDSFENKNIYGKQFIQELYKYVPNLKELTCIGGEPFLINEYYDIWDNIIHKNPSCKISVITNGTILNDKIKELLDKGNFIINLSFESLNKETYEKIRVNANFETVMSNMRYFGQVLKRQGKILEIPVCVLKDNCKEIPDLVRFCNDNSYHINILTTFRNIDSAAWSLTTTQLKKLKNFYQQQKFTTHDWCSESNVAYFKNFISTVDRWIVDAEKKENFQNIFDLKTDKVISLKKTLFDNIDKCLMEMSIDQEDLKTKRKYILEKWETIIKSVPDYFISNHLYIMLLQISPYVITQLMLKCNVNTILKILEEGFYYGFAH